MLKYVGPHLFTFYLELIQNDQLIFDIKNVIMRFCQDIQPIRYTFTGRSTQTWQDSIESSVKQIQLLEKKVCSKLLDKAIFDCQAILCFGIIHDRKMQVTTVVCSGGLTGVQTLRLLCKYLSQVSTVLSVCHQT